MSSSEIGAPEQEAQKSKVGKLTPEALYVHRDSISLLPPNLQELVKRAQAIAPETSTANIIKIYRRKDIISFLSYPAFDTVAHPPLATSVIVYLDTLTFATRDYTKSLSPPILHRKETFVGENYPHRLEFAFLSSKEEKAGLLGNSTIGTTRKWEALLVELGYIISGHQLLYASSPNNEENYESL